MVVIQRKNNDQGLGLNVEGGDSVLGLIVQFDLNEEVRFIGQQFVSRFHCEWTAISKFQ